MLFALNMDDENYIPLSNLNTNHMELTSEQLEFINRGSQVFEPVKLQLKN